MRTNRENLLWMIYILSGMWAMMDDSGYWDYEELTPERYKEIDYARVCEREAFVCIEKIIKMLLDGKDVHGVDIDDKSPFTVKENYWEPKDLKEYDRLWRLRCRLSEWGCEYAAKKENN